MRRGITLDLARRKTDTSDILKRLNTKKECNITVKRTKNKILQAIEACNELLRSGRLVDDGTTEVVTDLDRLKAYCKTIEENGIYAFDVETTGLNPWADIFVGFSFYTPGEKAIYVPLNHTDVNNERVSGQLELKEVVPIIKLILESGELKGIMHNAKFEFKVMRLQAGVKTKWVYWDTQIAACLLNENENHELKKLYAKYIEKGSKGEGFKELFGTSVPFNYTPLNVAGIYGAGDSYKTFKLYEFQKGFIHSEREDMKAIVHVMHDIEMPLLPAVVEMELRGVQIDKDFAKQLEEQYSDMLAEVKSRLDVFVSKYEDRIKAHPVLKRLAVNKEGKAEINYNSPKQLQPFIYDVLECPAVEFKWVQGQKTEDKGTGEEILKKLQTKFPKITFFSDLLEYRGINKLLTTYICKIPETVNPDTNAVHCQFKQCGARTGRFSSANPNLQNIPSKNKDIRKIFVAREGYLLVSVDYSQIEPRILASLSGDSIMREAYNAGRDLYAELASVIFEKPAEECGDGTEERSITKGILLGLMYDMQAESIAEKFRKPKRWGQMIYNTFFHKFPLVKRFVDLAVAMAEETGYITTIDGRKRRLPDIKKDPRTPAYKQAHRQVVNSIIQGSSADITKKAMIKIGTNEELKQMGVTMLITVHDEIISEVPKEYIKQAVPIILVCMREAAEETIDIPVKMDVEITDRWYGELFNDEYLKEVC